jgi:hypothetical protein
VRQRGLLEAKRTISCSTLRVTRGRPGPRRAFEPSNLWATSLRYQARMPGSRLHIRRNKKGTPATHPLLQGDTMRALRRLRKEAPHAEFVFVSERGSTVLAERLCQTCRACRRSDGFFDQTG